MMSNYFNKAVDEAEYDFGMQLVCNEQSERDVIEVNETWNGDTIGYSSKNVTNMSVEVEGFIWHHPHGAVIRGSFAKPIVLATAVVTEDGDELDSKNFETSVGKAILGKLGRISCLDDIAY